MTKKNYIPKNEGIIPPKKWVEYLERKSIGEKNFQAHAHTTDNVYSDREYQRVVDDWRRWYFRW